MFHTSLLILSFFFFFFNDTATTEIYTLSLHDALPISLAHARVHACGLIGIVQACAVGGKGFMGAQPAMAPGQRPYGAQADRKSTRLNSSHSQISYAVFCLKKKKKNTNSIASNLYKYNV